MGLDQQADVKPVEVQRQVEVAERIVFTSNGYDNCDHGNNGGNGRDGMAIIVSITTATQEARLIISTTTIPTNGMAGTITIKTETSRICIICIT